MKGAPNFKQWPDPVDGMWKIEFLHWLGKTTGVKTLIETGTCEGITPWNLREDFDRIHTIELHAGLFESASKRLSELKNVKQWFGSSRDQLANMIAEAGNGPILFWLDAHSSGPHTADDGDVLPFEIKTITSLCPDALIVVDDMMGLEQFISRTGSFREGWTCEYRTGEILMYQNGKYNIPEFE